MIGYLQGKILQAEPDRVLLDVGGVGYEVHVTLSTYSEIGQAEDSVALHVYTHVSDSALDLYGFWTEREKLLFEKLLGVGGIGPRLARVALSGMAPGDLIAAIRGGDAARLSTIPGVGKKTAQRMILELKDKLDDLGGDAATTVAVPAEDNLVSALVNLGYKQRDAQAVVAKSREESPDASFEDLLRQSLKRLSRA